MHPSKSGISPRAIGWALLSQVFWLPLVAIDLHDRWQAHQRDITPPGRALPASPIARARPFSLNDLLNATRPVQQLASQANHAVSGAVGQAVSGAGLLLSSAGSGASSLLDRPFSASLDSPAAPSSGAASHRATTQPAALPLSVPGPSLLGRSFTRSQLLGGSIGLSDLNEGPMAPLALAERALQASSGDPLAPLPSLWREPMRQALLKLPGTPQRLATARMVYVPSSRVSQPTVVPLALQSDGSVDVLEPPSDPSVLRDIETWSRLQRPPATGSLQPAVVHLSPMPAALQNAPMPAAQPARPAAASQPVASPAPAARAAAAPKPSSPASAQAPVSRALSLPAVPSAPVPASGRSTAPSAAAVVVPPAVESAPSPQPAAPVEPLAAPAPAQESASRAPLELPPLPPPIPVAVATPAAP